MKHFTKCFFHSFGTLGLALISKLDKELFAIPSGNTKSKVSTHIHCTHLNPTFIYLNTTKIQNDPVVDY